MSRLRLERVTPGEQYTQVATLFDSDHWTSQEGGARASLAYDPVKGTLAWTARDRPGGTGEFKAVPFSQIAGMATGDEVLLSELRRATDLAKRYARKRIKALREDGSEASLRTARSLEAAVKSPWLRTTR